MRLHSLRLRNFRCFGPEWTEIRFEHDVTALIGANGSGKTTVLLALARLFGIGRTQRMVVRRDFHVPPGNGTPNSPLLVEAIFEFPELDGNEETYSVPEYFRHMCVDREGGALTCRLCLRATWQDDGTAEGAIEEEVRCILEPPSVDALHANWQENPRVSAAERAGIQLIYVPAYRDVAREVSAALNARLWRAARWSEDFRKTAEDRSRELEMRFRSEPPVRSLIDILGRRWRQLHRADIDRDPLLRLMAPDLDQLVRRGDFVFRPDESGGERDLDDLSDGQKTLFHIGLTAATLEFERQAILCSDYFEADKIHAPHLTLLAIEEPENHLSPFFLSRILSQARELACRDGIQVLLSTHSASALQRVHPSEIRFFRLDETRRVASVRNISLPEKSKEIERYVRLAVRTYPELYFARFVILAEGDSERIVIPRVAEAMGIPLDPSFVPVVPIGSRHPEHIQRLLKDLDIPHALLLDLDYGRAGGGVNRLQQICSICSVDHEPHLPSGGGSDIKEIKKWMKSTLRELERVHIFFSCPLDLDMMLLKAFFEEYRDSCEGHGPIASAGWDELRHAVLKTGGSENDYDESRWREFFLWYRYLFLGRSKPDTHFAALSRISEEELAKRAPSVLQRLVHTVARELGLEADTP